MPTTEPALRRRHHRATLAQHDRRALERAGWRTLLTYCENHVRTADGTLIQAVPCWTAEAEWMPHGPGRVTVLSATAPSPDEAWAALRRKTADADRRTGRHRAITAA